MLDQEKIRLMTRLAILEKQHGRQIRKAENRFRIDRVTNPVWKKTLLATLLFFAAAAALCAFQVDMILDAVASGQIRNIILIVLTAYLCVLIVTITVTSALSWAGDRKVSRWQRQHHAILERLRRMNEYEQQRSGHAGRREGTAPDRQEGLRPQDMRGEERRSPKRREDDLDYRRTVVLEFEDDEYSYYVEATPRRGGHKE